MADVRALEAARIRADPAFAPVRVGSSVAGATPAQQEPAFDLSRSQPGPGRGFANPRRGPRR